MRLATRPRQKTDATLVNQQINILGELGAAVAYWLERRIQDRNEDFEREFPLVDTLSKV